jgi:peroxiredoxin
MSAKRAYDWFQRLALVIAVLIVIGLTLRSRGILEAYNDLHTRAETPHAGVFVPPMRTATLSGEEVVVGEPEEQGVQVLYYFTTTCPYCLQSIPAWQEIASRASEHGVAVYAISLDPAEEAAAYVAEHGLSYPVVTLPHRKYRALYRTRRIPQTVIVDSDGQVAYGRPGLLTDPVAIDSVIAALSALSIDEAQIETSPVSPVVIR